MDKADISAQVEVQRLQIQILIETVNEKEKEIEKEKQLIAESKEEANTRVIGTEPSLEEAVTGVGEYKVCFSFLFSFLYHDHLNIFFSGYGRNVFASCKSKSGVVPSFAWRKGSPSTSLFSFPFLSFPSLSLFLWYLY